MASDDSHRYSMPVSRSRNGAHESGLDGANVTRFLFDDEEGGSGSHQNAGDERFPTLVRRDDQIVSQFHFPPQLSIVFSNCWQLLAMGG